MDNSLAHNPITKANIESHQRKGSIMKIFDSSSFLGSLRCHLQTIINLCAMMFMVSCQINIASTPTVPWADFKISDIGFDGMTSAQTKEWLSEYGKSEPYLGQYEFKVRKGPRLANDRIELSYSTTEDPYRLEKITFWSEKGIDLKDVERWAVTIAQIFRRNFERHDPDPTSNNTSFWTPGYITDVPVSIEIVHYGRGKQVSTSISLSWFFRSSYRSSTHRQLNVVIEALEAF